MFDCLVYLQSMLLGVHKIFQHLSLSIRDRSLNVLDPLLVDTNHNVLVTYPNDDIDCDDTIHVDSSRDTNKKYNLDL